MQHIFTPVWHKRTCLKYDLIGLQHLTTWIKTLLISPGEVLAEDIDQALNPTGITRVGFSGYKNFGHRPFESCQLNWKAQQDSACMESLNEAPHEELRLSSYCHMNLLCFKELYLAFFFFTVKT